MSDTPNDGPEEDVNDVLSSIRELVSQEAKSHAEIDARKKAEAEEQAQAEAEQERLAAEIAEAERAALQAAESAAAETAPEPLVLGKAERVAETQPTDAGPAKASKPEPLRMDKAALVTPVAAAPSPATTGDAPMYDEAALRTLIVEVVREEMQGDLGDRLNRNIRKIVRREVLRALDEDDDDLGGGLKI